MKKNIVKYTKDVAELLEQKNKYHLSDNEYEKKLREIQHKNGIIVKEGQRDSSQNAHVSQKLRTPVEERLVKEFIESKDFRNRFILSVIYAVLARARKEDLITGEEYIMCSTKARDIYQGNNF